MRKRKVGIMLLALAMLANIAAVVPTGTAAYAQQGTGSYTMEHLGRDDLLKNVIYLTDSCICFFTVLCYDRTRRKSACF